VVSPPPLSAGWFSRKHWAEGNTVRLPILEKQWCLVPPPEKCKNDVMIVGWTPMRGRRGTPAGRTVAERRHGHEVREEMGIARSGFDSGRLVRWGKPAAEEEASIRTAGGFFFS
jgi:hypothetical protein